MTLDQFEQILRAINSKVQFSSDLLEALNNIEEKLDKLQFINFLNQAAFETQGFNRFEENLNYSSPERLMAVWPSLFKSKYNPEEYIRNPQKLGSLVYANKLGNGNIESGDGYRFRGRGAFHLTGKANYEQCSLDMYNDHRLVNNPDLVTRFDIAFETAYWFWIKSKCNNLVSEQDCSAITKKITGCLLTKNERNAQYNKLKEILL